MTAELLSAPKAAIRLTHILELFCTTHDIDRFPVDVEYIALGCAEIFGWPDPITKIEAADIDKFEGCLFPSDNKKNWLVLYNNTLSEGRIRFVKAHELGHYILHRTLKDSFECTNSDMLNWTDDEKNLEAQADRFSSYLLMPLNDYRKQVPNKIELDCFSHCADRYGVSLIAAILKWLEYTEEKAILVLSRDGFINWASSSKPAMRSGAFFRTRNNIISVPIGSLAADSRIKHNRTGTQIPLSVWFKDAEEEITLNEMKIISEQFDSIITLLCLPRGVNVWPPLKIK